MYIVHPETLNQKSIQNYKTSVEENNINYYLLLLL